ncbi:MAG: hypothetical protein U0939_27010 [Pirellulales bacterium]
MARTSDAWKRADWESRLRRYRASGLAIGAFCTREGVSASAFYYWSRRLGGRDSSTATSKETSKPATDRALGADADVVRCVMDGLTRAMSAAVPAFREVVVKPS